MKKFKIIWDFDGTILPSTPYDSEQSLLMYRMNQKDKPFSRLKKGYTKAIIYADQREWLRKGFKKSYIRLLKGTPASVLDKVCRNLAEKISTADRNCLQDLKNAGHAMIVLSCGTADLSERILKFAGIAECFDLIKANRFRFNKNRITGMDPGIADPDDKLAMMNKLNLSPERTIVVGDGYTDLPLLNWSSIPVVIDRTGKKKKGFTSNRFHFITSIPEIMNIIKETAT
ncbi:MAG: HAD family hydrolase [Desulfobacterales bacterium]|jgi:phosphoserine phosphatase